MAIILGGLFFGVSLLARYYHPYPSHNETVLSELGRAIFGGGPLYVVLQVATASILTLAANTAYADFPRLSSIIARDGFLPRQLFNRGDRLVFSNGVLALAGTAGLLIVVFGAQTDALVPLYAVGVFTAFTLSQTGMVRHHLRLREPGWQWRLVINALGAVATFVVLLVVAGTKFTSGAWIPILIVPLVVAGFMAVRRFYDHLATALAVSPEAARPNPQRHGMVVMVGQLHLGILNALDYARGLCPAHVVALHVAVDEDDGPDLQRRWQALGIDVPLDVITAPHRHLDWAVKAHLDELRQRWPGVTTITVVTSQYAGGGIFDDLLHNQSLVLLRERLMVESDVAVISVPYRIR
jgi:hypothetical protein